MKALVAVTDSVFPNLDPALQVLSRIGAEIRLARDSAASSILEVGRDADAVLTTYAKLTGDLIAQFKRCRIIARFGIGVDNVDIAAATSAGILVTRVPDYCLDEVADHTMALLLALVRKIPSANARTHSGHWEMPAVVPIHRLRGTTLGLVGFGQIPQLVAPRAKAFGLRVVAYDPYLGSEVFERASVERADFTGLLKLADYISIHTPLTPETYHLFNPDVFSRMKPGALLINTARGPIVDEIALACALDERQVAGAALDVMEKEPPVASPLFGRENVILTPHTSFYSEESLVDLQIKASEEVCRVLTGEPPRNPVNMVAAKTAS